ncbi:MAG: O-acetyl-ADP-ribose deacetylase [Bacilli bacterium]|nr:O-acetyl-ADP-ribose deacetylase [Bacilli bacterium]
MALRIEHGDITKYGVDAIVNAANSSLLGGGGVDGAIHRAAGPELLAECKTLGGCPTGEAKITKGYNLMAKWILHTVGPIYNENRKDECEELLKSCYKNSIALALLNECKSIAFPLISAGVYGYPKVEALDIAVSCIQRFADEMDTVIVLFDAEAYEIAKRNYSELIA